MPNVDVRNDCEVTALCDGQGVITVAYEDRGNGTSHHARARYLYAIARQVRGPCALVKLEGCGHSPFREQPEATIDAIVRFVDSLNADGPDRARPRSMNAA